MSIFISTIILIGQLSLQICTSEELQLEKQAHYFQSKTKGVVESNFELVGGLIFLEAELNGKTEQFILDTGAPHLMLNTQKPKSKRVIGMMQGVGGNKRITRARGHNFNWNGINTKRKESYAVDLANIAKAKNKDFAGMISYDQVRNREVVLDYEHKKLFLLKKKSHAFFSNHNKTDKVRLRMVGHIPVVKVKIGKKKYYFGLDTGAEVNVIDKRLKKKLPKEFVSARQTKTVVGKDARPITVQTTQLKSIKIGKSEYENMDFAFTDLSFLADENGFQIDGLLGFPFLNQGTYSIDYRKKVLNKWESKLSDEELIQIVLAKKNIKATEPLVHRN